MVPPLPSFVPRSPPGVPPTALQTSGPAGVPQALCLWAPANGTTAALDTLVDLLIVNVTAIEQGAGSVVLQWFSVVSHPGRASSSIDVSDCNAPLLMILSLILSSLSTRNQSLIPSVYGVA